MPLTFEWDEIKAHSNETRHGVTFDEAKTVFNDPFGLSVADPEHSTDEERWLDVGLSNLGRLLVVWYTESGETVRIIGARTATRIEAAAYTHERR